jgi:general secretion pathway protein K
MNFHFNKHLRGVALITALLIAALVAAIAAAALALQSREIARLERATDRAQLAAFLSGGFDWAKSVLAIDKRANKIDHLSENWATPLTAIPIEGATVNGNMQDAQGQFNLNLLIQNGRADTAWVNRYRALLVELKLPNDLADALVDWIDSDSDGQYEDSVYLFLDPPYRAANRTLINTTELANVRGYTADVIVKLAPYISALPTNAKRTVNANTADAIVLRAVLSTALTAPTGSDAKPQIIDTEKLKNFIEARKTKPLENASELGAQLGLTNIGTTQEALTVESDFFTARFEVRQGQARLAGNALISRAQTSWPSIITLQYQ